MKTQLQKTLRLAFKKNAGNYTILKAKQNDNLTPICGSILINWQKSKMTLMFCFCYLGSFAQVPTITSFSPLKGPVGTSVTITGTNFDPVQGNNIVKFGAVKGVVTSATATQLTATVPVGFTNEPINVTTNSLTAYGNLPFVVTFGNDGYSFRFSLGLVLPQSVSNFSSDNGNPTNIYTQDFNIDGKPDLGTSHDQGNYITLLKNIVSPPYIFFSLGYSWLDRPITAASSDLDGDGRPDFAFASSQNKLTTRKNDPGYFLDIQLSYNSGEYNTGTLPISMVIKDINGDGKPDIVVANSIDNSISIFKNKSVLGSILLEEKVDFPVGTSPLNMVIADFDGDGKPDIIVANTISNNISILRNTGEGSVISFANKTDLPAGTTPYGIATGDIDNDGKPEVIFTSAGDNLVSVLKNISTVGNIAFSPKTSFATGNNPRGVAVGDLSGDGLVDIVVTNYNSNTIYLYMNNSNATISFQLNGSQGTEINPIDVVIGDFNIDGKPDLAVVNYTSKKVSTYANAQAAPLPVTWLNFTATPSNNKVDLTWATATEVNTESYIVERSLDGISFTPLHNTKAAGNASANSHYSYTDNNLAGLAGKTAYYRIKQLDKDGRASFSVIKQVEIAGNNPSFVRVYPTVFQNTLQLKFNQQTAAEKDDQVSLLSSDGRVMYRRSLAGRSGVNVSLNDLPNLPAGIYLLSVQAGKQVFTTKVVRE